jgi:hypothetical protein
LKSILTMRLASLNGLAAVLLAAACGGSPTQPGPAPLPAGGVVAEQRCSDGDTYVVGPYTYANNQWGKGKVPSGQTYQQCLQTRTVNGRTQYGWTFNWPGHEPSVYAYPEIMFGWTPWGGGSSSHAGFPMKVDGMPPVTVDYDVESAIGGHYNLAGEVWLTRTGGAGAARPDDIATEIMFWLDYDGTMGPAGRVVARPTVAGVPYDLYKADFEDWTYLAYKGPPGRLAGSLPVDAFVRDAVSRGFASADHFVSGVEFGNECAGGAGTTWVRRYDVRVGR